MFRILCDLCHEEIPTDDQGRLKNDIHLFTSENLQMFLNFFMVQASSPLHVCRTCAIIEMRKACYTEDERLRNEKK